MPKCRLCKKEFDKTKLKENADWVMPSKGWYYHKECYDNWVVKKNDVRATAADDEWKDLLWDYLKRDVRMPGMDFGKMDSQWHNFLYSSKKKMTAKGLFFAAKYFYSVKNGNVKDADGGIGILPYVYDDSCRYWTEREVKNKELYKKIEEQIVQKENRTVEVKQQRIISKEKAATNLASIANMEDDDD